MNILLTSAGRRTYMIEYFKNALNGSGLVFASNSVLTYSLMKADDYILTPDIYEENYIDFLLDYCKEKSVTAIIPLFDIDLPVLSKNKKRFDNNGIRLIVSSERSIEICNDKWQTYQFLCSIGLNHPKTYISIKECMESIEQGEIYFPLIIKPRWGMGSIGILEVDSFDELDFMYKKLKRNILNTYLKFESEQDINACIIIQQKVIGKEYGLDILNDLDGNYTATVAKQKLAMRAGETDIAQIVENTFFLETSKIISQSLKHIGNLDVDCFVSDNGDIYILEMNCRFGGQYPFSHLSGVDFPAQIVRWLEGLPIDEKLITPQYNITACKELLPVILHKNN
jgi:carbamoyl-phosphate synthase large subunit